MARWTLLLALVGCSETSFFEVPVQDPELQITSPTYGEFVGDRILVEGSVISPKVEVWLEGQRLPVEDDGTFSAELPIEKGWRNVDLTATIADITEQERIPVFRGQDPIETWPGGVGLRLTPRGLSALGDLLDATLGGIDLASMFGNILPDIDLGLFSLSSAGASHDPIAIDLEPTADGLELALNISNFTFDFDLTIDLQGFPIDLGAQLIFDEIRLGLIVDPVVDEDGMISLDSREAVLDISEPRVEVPLLPVDFLGDILGSVIGLADGLLDPLADSLVGLLDIPLGGPFDFNIDLLGDPLNLRLSNIFTTPVGVGAEIGVGIGEPAPMGQLNLPLPEQVSPRDTSHAVLHVHDQLLQPILQSDLLAILEQDIVLPGVLGGFIQVVIDQQPGSSALAEEDITGWCLGLQPGPARLARFQPSLEGTVVIWMPDTELSLGYQVNGGNVCQPWMDSNVALEVELGLSDGLALDLGLHDPLLLDYAGSGWADGTASYSDDEVLAPVSTLVTNLTGLLGGLGGLGGDGGLGDLLGGLGGDLGGLGDLGALQISSVEDAEGDAVEIGVRIFE